MICQQMKKMTEDMLRQSLTKPYRCACGKMPVADVTQEEPRFKEVQEFTGVRVCATCNTRCNVCGHEAVKQAVGHLPGE